MGWWNANRTLYPTIFRLAVRYLSVPASSAAVERQFSKAKSINSPHRRSVRGETMSAMVLLREHMSVFDTVEANKA
jgi:hypothetical protein